jgi:hypothetical protein
MKRLREIIRKMDQGATEAILCRADDGVRYVVKTRLSGRDALVKEWLCASIGNRMGLPIPTVELVYMDSGAQYSVFPEAAALTDCLGFASELVEPADTLNTALIAEVPASLRAVVLLFDWWIINGDRQDANPNLLWLAHAKELFVFDHNLAFGSDAPEEFWKHHIFRNDRAAMSALKAGMLSPMSAIIDDLPGLWTGVPEVWRDGCLIGLNQVDKILRRCLDETFWMVQ